MEVEVEEVKSYLLFGKKVAPFDVALRRHPSAVALRAMADESGTRFASVHVVPPAPTRRGSIHREGIF